MSGLRTGISQSHQSVNEYVTKFSVAAVCANDAGLHLTFNAYEPQKLSHLVMNRASRDFGLAQAILQTLQKKLDQTCSYLAGPKAYSETVVP